MKHVKILNMPDCKKLIYSDGMMGRQIGAMIVMDDEDGVYYTHSYPIIDGGKQTADGMVLRKENYETYVVCEVEEELTLRDFSKLVRRTMSEDVPPTSIELYNKLREYDCDLQLPVMADTKEPVRRYNVELEFFEFRDICRCKSVDHAYFYFDVYYEKDNHDDLFEQLLSQLMDYMNVLDSEKLYSQIVFNTVYSNYGDVIKRLNTEKIDTLYCNMYDPR